MPETSAYGLWGLVIINSVVFIFCESRNGLSFQRWNHRRISLVGTISLSRSPVENVIAHRVLRMLCAQKRPLDGAFLNRKGSVILSRWQLRKFRAPIDPAIDIRWIECRLGAQTFKRADASCGCQRIFRQTLESVTFSIKPWWRQIGLSRSTRDCRAIVELSALPPVTHGKWICHASGMRSRLRQIELPKHARRSAAVSRFP